MKTGNHLQKKIIILVGLACFSLGQLASNTFGVVPAPDGGYPNFNTAEGQKALFSLTTGQWNTALGAFTLWKNTDGSFNTAVGTAALLFNAGDQSAGEGLRNTAVGAASLLLNSTGSKNTAIGVVSLLNNTTGVDNTAIGDSALTSNTEGFNNTATGVNALYSNTQGHNNTATGRNALTFNVNGHDNTATGLSALNNNISGPANTATGTAALSQNTTGGSNTATGLDALTSNTTGNFNTADGTESLFHNNGGDGNTAGGYHALFNNTSATGDFNTAYGYQALLNNTTGAANTALGFAAGIGVHTAINVITIGAAGDDVNDSCYIGNIWSQSGGTQAVYVNSAGKLGFQASSRRFKDDIKPMEQASEVIYGLKPVSFRYKASIEPSRPLSFGLIAEDVEKISQDLVARGDDGKVNSVRYDLINAMLLNEFLKEHATVQELKKEIEALKAGLQEVNNELGSRPVQLIANHQFR